MLVVRFVVLFAALFLLGLGVAYVLTRQRKYLRIAWRTMQIVLLLLEGLLIPHLSLIVLQGEQQRCQIEGLFHGCGIAWVGACRT